MRSSKFTEEQIAFALKQDRGKVNDIGWWEKSGNGRWADKPE